MSSLAIPPVYSVGQALKLCNNLFTELDLIVEGEIAQFSINRGTYVFFDLKDEKEDARVGCFMMAHQLSTPLEDGMRVMALVKPGIYTKSGAFRFTVKQIKPEGEGSLKRAFELLKAKLDKEGLFATARKRPIPRFPQKVGVIASTESAGYGDFMRIVSSRLTGLQLIVTDVAVQGKDAEAQICSAFDYLNSHYDLDCIVLMRGGGSLEDLHAFNSETVARAIVRSKAPVIVGVGHERDVTIADYCADLRASTPSNAAQLLVCTKEEVIQKVGLLLSRGQSRIHTITTVTQQQTVHRLSNISDRLKYHIEYTRRTVTQKVQIISNLSPQQTLERGYSLTTTEQGKPIRSINDTSASMKLITHLKDGTITSVTT